MKPKMQMIQCAATAMAIRRKLSAMTTVKNTRYQEFAHWTATRLTSERNIAQMQKLQYSAIAMAIQMKLMKQIRTLKNKMDREFQ
jgi:hypothetical protein